MTIYLIGCSIVLLIIILDYLFWVKNDEKYLLVGHVAFALLLILFSWLSTALYIWYLLDTHVNWNSFKVKWNRFWNYVIIDWRK